eukprot:CAMPEP_0179360574 /NCGR_PEP_ID=MMETSP0797-20121207/80051_1 /TAXON_ID=47934 /ORGANISM="Dinophysis acuminata, Strain DAEP01" /LENGTH=206 /DNA_ID=CAMNT_0021075941 /DNA_START=217 /DNA_END=837 /DNA_ORIENTATION=-
MTGEGVLPQLAPLRLGLASFPHALAGLVKTSRCRRGGAVVRVLVGAALALGSVGPERAAVDLRVGAGLCGFPCACLLTLAVGETAGVQHVGSCRAPHHHELRLRVVRPRQAHLRPEGALAHLLALDLVPAFLLPGLGLAVAPQEHVGVRREEKLGLAPLPLNELRSHCAALGVELQRDRGRVPRPLGGRLPVVELCPELEVVEAAQ